MAVVGNATLLHVLKGGIYPESACTDGMRRSWVSATCLKWEESSGAFCEGTNMGPGGMAALADHCHQGQV